MTRKYDWSLILKFPIPILTKIYKTILQVQINKNEGQRGTDEYEKKNTDLIKKMDDQKILTNISLILEASLESSFQFLHMTFKGVVLHFSLPLNSLII